VDSIEGVTHALRSSEYHDRNPLYYWVVDSLKLRRPYIQDFSRLNFTYTLLSKRKLQWFVEKGIVAGWNDPRFPTIQGVLRRGLTVEALREFILSQGASKSLNLMEPEKLWALNRKILDPIVPRYTAVAKFGKVLLKLTNGPQAQEAKSVPKHKKNASLGNKVIVFTNQIWLEKEDAAAIEKGEEITLMDWGNAFVDEIVASEDGTLTLTGRLHPEGSVKNTKKKLTWLSNIEDLVDVTLVNYGHLITKPKLEENDDFTHFINPHSKTEVRYFHYLYFLSRKRKLICF
jgi:glutamyl-tRNA synthetase